MRRGGEREGERGVGRGGEGEGDGGKGRETEGRREGAGQRQDMDLDRLHPHAHPCLKTWTLTDFIHTRTRAHHPHAYEHTHA